MEMLEGTPLVDLVKGFLAEDIGRGDRTTDSVIPEDASGKARIEAREEGVIAGLDAARACFEVLAPSAMAWRPELADGDRVESGGVVARLRGPLRAILTGERTALNLLARLSGTATLTRRFVDAVGSTSVKIVDTRKTTPGLRLLEKYAVRVGGGANHRLGLDDGILIKDNHIAAAGGISEAVARARADSPHGLKIEVEVQDLEELDEALAAAADIILLDNMLPETIRDAVARAGGKALLEVSGGIKLDNIATYAATGVDLISVGALTHSARALDLSLEVEER
ncbi:MAG: carboxylating nicotinate-nucleotide diphosphorylase [Actinomycetota bacterium]|nr:carboxylating nicotinate-nucleotide diphosphorylase [Actinomycetota bacterium]